MKQIIQLQDWFLTQVEPHEDLSYLYENAAKGDQLSIGKPVTVLEALIAAGKVDGSIREDGEGEYCKWVAEKDWLYRCDFDRPKTNGIVFINFGGLDTVCDIWLNGAKIAEHRTMYLPLRIDVTDLMQGKNRLAVYFHSPYKFVSYCEKTMPERWKGIVDPHTLLRKAPCDFRNYLGATPYFTPVGIFEDVCLEMPDWAELCGSECSYVIKHDLSSAEVTMTAEVTRMEDGAEVEFILRSPSGEIVFSQRVSAEPLADGVLHAKASFSLQQPMLWWPRGYGNQPVYYAEFGLYSEGVLRDTAYKLIGFRRIELVGSLKFRINGIVVRFWGSNIATMGSISHRWEPDRAMYLLDKAEMCNFNALRVWGPGEVVGDEFYNEADRRGIMIWQDFFIEPSQLPDSPEYIDLFKAEAEYLIRRLRNHPSLLMWCGSNESMYMNEFHEEDARIGINLITCVFPALCEQLDPNRYYHTSCPSEGQYANDPLFGDTHGSRSMMSYLPGEEHAVFFSEDIYTAPPKLESMKRFIKEEDIWPNGFVDIAAFGKSSCFPPALERRTNNFSQNKLGPIERFYDATDAGSLIYKYTAAAGYGYYHNIVKQRCGKPASDSSGERRSNGYLVWKFNNTWPQFYCGLVDFYGEVHIPYYSVRRAFESFLLTFEVSDHIYVWGVNDTPEDITGTLIIKLFRISQNQVIKEFKCCAAVPAGESVVITNLDSLRYFRRDCVLYASLEKDDIQLGRTVEFVDLERHLPFGQSKLGLRTVGDMLYITTDSFARCVELSGISKDGNGFGWHFEDNYFDLLPFETKAVRISGTHKAGQIIARAHYSQIATSIDWDSATANT